MTQHDHDWVVRRIERTEYINCFTCGESKPEVLTFIEGCLVCEEAQENSQRTGLAYRCPAHT